MKCAICGNEFYTKKSLFNFFKMKEYDICYECFKKYKIDVQDTVIPIGNKKMIIISLFSKIYYFKNYPFFNEFSKLFLYIYKNINNDNLFIYDNFFINEEILITFENISKLINGNVYIICSSFSL